MHSEIRTRVLDEVEPVLVHSGQFLFTDPVLPDDCLEGILQLILDQIQLSTLASLNFYHEELIACGFEEAITDPHTCQLHMHYWRVGEALKARYDETVSLSGQT